MCEGQGFRLVLVAGNWGWKVVCFKRLRFDWIEGIDLIEGIEGIEGLSRGVLGNGGIFAG